jgi:predicted anti-sigma-YlaC factor YlaD
MNDHPSQWMQSGLNCRNVAGFASEYLDDHLPMLTKIRVSLHLASCADCRIYMKQMALVCEVAASFPKPYPTLVTRLRLRQHFVAQYPR